MASITEILAEVFNRVKTEHGVTLSRVDFAPTSGGVGLSFKAVGCHLELRDALVVPQQVQPVPPPNTPPPGATHYGSLDGGVHRLYYRYANGGLSVWRGREGWRPCVSLSDATDAELVDQLTPLKQSSSDSDS